MSRALPEQQHYDLIVPVPLHRSGLRQRTYNQAALLAHELGRRMECQVDQRVLVKKYQTLPQHNLSASEREQNLQQAFALTRSVSDRHVLLVDDVFTTGATVASCSKVLLAGGAAQVTVVTAARTG